MNAPIIVTGGAGYIGSHVCKELGQSGFIPIALDNLSTGHRWAVKWGPLILRDVRDKEFVKNVFREVKPHGVIHLAGHIEARVAPEMGPALMENNVLGTSSVLCALGECGFPPLIFASSAAIYESSPEAIQENHPHNPLNPYAQSKKMCETLVKKEAPHHAILRLFNVAGADLEGEIGEAHPEETHLIPLALLAAMQRIPPITLYGCDHMTPDGSAERDFIHVHDVARAMILSLKALISGGESFTANLGSGIPHSVLKVLAGVEKAVGKVPTQLQPKRVDEPSRLFSDSTYIRQRLGFIPHHSALNTIVETAYKWLQRCPL